LKCGVETELLPRSRMLQIYIAKDGAIITLSEMAGGEETQTEAE